MPMTVRAVVFDVGGVLTSSPFDAFARYERERGLPDGFLRTVNATDADTNAWARLERREIDLDDFAELFGREAAALGHPVDGRDVLGLLSGDLRPAMVEAVRRCAARLSTALLTNNFVVDPSMERADLAEVYGIVDVVLESSKLGVRKPDPRIYELTCQALDVEPADVVFLDDLGVNLKPARALGMHTIKVTDPDAALEALAEAVGFPVSG